MQCAAAKPDLLPRDNNTGTAARGLDISELFSFTLRCAVRHSREIEKEEKKRTGKIDIYIESLLGVRLFLLIPLHGLEVQGLAEKVEGLCSSQLGD